MSRIFLKSRLLFLASLQIAMLSSCISGTAVKKLGRGTLNLVKTDTATSETFKFDFAYRESSDGTSTGVPETTIFLRGIANSKNVMIATCNSTGSNCTCDFFDAAGALLAPTTSTSVTVSYNSSGNFFMCSTGGTTGIVAANVVSARLRNRSSSKISATLTVTTGINNLTINNIMGDLDINRVRGVFRYRCMWTFLQKLGTSTTGFTCADNSLNGGVLTATRGCGDATAAFDGSAYQGDLCFLKVQYPYFVFRDANLNNFSLRATDGLYSSVGSCFPMLKRFDCTATQKYAPSDATETGVEPTAVLGLMADQVGVYENPISFQASPLVSDSAYGFAAATITFNSLTICPPGLKQFRPYTATPANGNASFPSQGTDLDAATNHNFPSNFTAKNVDAEPTRTAETLDAGVPGPIQVVKIVGKGNNVVSATPNPFSTDTGDCATAASVTACQFPDRRQAKNDIGTIAVGASSATKGVAQVTTWTAGAGTTVFCAIPAAKVPNLVGGG